MGILTLGQTLYNVGFKVGSLSSKFDIIYFGRQKVHFSQSRVQRMLLYSKRGVTLLQDYSKNVGDIMYFVYPSLHRTGRSSNRSVFVNLY